jgi:hypothetical protein
MADVAVKAINANDVKSGTAVVHRGGGLGTARFDYDTESQKVNPTDGLPTNWDSQLDTRMDDPRYYEGDTTA